MNKSDASILARIRILKGLSEKELDKITGRCDRHRYDPVQVILDRDSASTDVYFVLESEVQVVNYSILGRENQFATFGRGD